MSSIASVRQLCSLVLGAGILWGGSARGQSVPVADPLPDYRRLLQLTGSLPLAPVGERSQSIQPTMTGSRSTGADPWVSAFPAGTHALDSTAGLKVGLLAMESIATVNSDRPWGYNDGALWQGRGVSSSFSAGVQARWGPIRAAIRPIATWSQNAEFELSPLSMQSGLSPFAYPLEGSARIDWPQRFGDGSVRRIDLGSSFVRAEIGPVAMGLSNENRWWGPGRRNAITMTNTGPGFGHAFVGTTEPLNVGVGTLSFDWIWGRLRESGFFDSDAANDSRFLTGAVASLMPKWLPGLELGATRVFVQSWRPGGPSAEDALLVFIPLQKNALITAQNPTGDDVRDQIASVFARWAFPESGTEVYLEWGKGDHSADLRDLLVEPEHASGYVAGFQKVFPSPSGSLWRFSSEMTLLAASRTSLLRAPGSAFYVHGRVLQGYTHRGQLLGAGIGPGASQIFAGLDHFAPWGRAGVGLFRTVYNNDRYYQRNSPTDFLSHEVEPSVNADLLIFRGRWDVGGSVTASNLLNQHYVTDNDSWNLNLALSARFHPGRR